VPAKIDRRHLVIDGGRGPVMEIKWNTVRGHFSHRRHLRRLGVRQAKGFSKSVDVWQLPAGWKQALQKFDVSGFKWQKQGIGGRGALLFCPSCRTATLIQFFSPAAGEPDRTPRQVLATFRDHRDDGFVDWIMFDLRARVPQEMSLIRHRFEPGRFELTFSDRYRQVSLYRWGLATELLKKNSLAEFAQRIAAFTPVDWSTIRCDGADGVEGARRPPAGPFAWLSRLRPKSSFFWMRVWHLPHRNRILGVEASGRRPLDRRVLEQISRSYETV
jgi:hypothetical protein